MILHNPYGFQFQFRDGYTVSVHVPRAAQKPAAGELNTFTAEYYHVLFFQYHKGKIGTVYNLRKDFQRSDTMEGETSYEKLSSLMFAINRFILQFDLDKD